MSVSRVFAATVYVGLLTAASPVNAATTYTFVQFDVPGSTGTAAFGINDVEQIVGSFANSGFVRDASGNFTTIAVPNQSNTAPRGINNAGQIVGFFFTPRVAGGGFLYTDGSFAIIRPPPSDLCLFPEDSSVHGINNAGQILGNCFPSGFVDTGGSFTYFVLPPSGTASGINDEGQIVGGFNAPPGLPQSRGFLRDTNGSLTPIDVPGATSTTASGINNAGQIVGSFGPRGAEHGFLYTGGTFLTVDVPGATDTEANGINNAAQIVGTFVDSTGQHGFVATPVFAGTPGKANCHGQSVSALARQYHGLNAAAAALEFPSMQALQNAIMAFCED